MVINGRLEEFFVISASSVSKVQMSARMGLIHFFFRHCAALLPETKERIVRQKWLKYSLGRHLRFLDSRHKFRL